MHTQDRHESAQNIFSRRNFLAAAAYFALPIEGMARTCEVSPRHLWYVITGHRRPSGELLAKLRALLGEPGWAYATGATNVLESDTPPAAEAQP